MLNKNKKYKILSSIFLFAVILFVSNSIYAQNAIDHFYKAIALEKYNEISLAENEYYTAIQLDNMNGYYKIALGEFYYKNLNFNRAKQMFLSAEKLKSNSASLYLAKVYSIEGNIDSSILYLKNYLGYYKKIAKNEIVNDVAFENVKNSDKWTNLWKNNYYSPAFEMFQEAEYLHVYSNSSEALNETNLMIKKYKKFAPAYYLKAQILVEGNNYNEALDNINKAIDFNSSYPEYFLSRARIYSSLLKYSKAIVDYKKYMSMNVYDIELYKEISNVYFLNKQYDQALEVISFYTKFFDKDYDALFFMSKINYEAENYLNTISILNNLFVQQPVNSDYYHLRALAYMNANSYELAFHDFSQVLDLDPTKTDCYYYRGIVNLKMENIQNACVDWKIAIKNKDYRANDYFYKYCKDFQ